MCSRVPSRITSALLAATVMTCWRVGQEWPGPQPPLPCTRRRWPADPETNRELGVRVLAAQIGQREQRLPARGQVAPVRAALTTPGSQQVGQVAKGRTGQIDPQRVDKHVASACAVISRSCSFRCASTAPKVRSLPLMRRAKWERRSR